MSTHHCFPRLVSFAAVVLLCVGMAQQAEAQAPSGAAGQPTTVFPPGEWTLTPFVGFGFSGDLDNATGLFGASLGYIWDDRTALEGEVSYLPSSEASGLVEVDTQVFNVTANLLYHFRGRESWVPYGAVGMGFGHSNADVKGVPDDAFDDSSSAFVFNFGGGVERRINPRLAFRGDLRYFFGSDLVPDYWRLSAGLGFRVFQ
ncbi:MAG: porin family protein [Vicinamibacterales bacterium]